MSVVGISVVTLVGVYICQNVLLAASAALLAGIRALNGVLPRPLAYRQMLLIGRLVAVTAMVLPILALWQGGSELSPLRAQVWAAPSMHAGALTMTNGAQIDLGVDSVHALLRVNAAADLVLMILAVGLLITLVPLLAEVRAIFRSIRRAHVIRNIGGIRILVSDEEQVPFAAWLPGRSIIVLPTALLLRPADVRLALRHEGQHHRQGDTRIVYATLLGRALFGVNPAVHWLTRQLLELQEFACDEALARQPGYCRHTYCGCLLRVAEGVLGSRQFALRSFMARRHSFVLGQRIEAALRRPARLLRTPTAACFGVIAVSLLTALSAVIAVPVHDRRLSRTDAEHLVAATPGAAAWGLTVNDAVLKQLNLLLGTPDGRAFIGSSIERMHDYEPGLLTELKDNGLPPQLLMVPLVESGYQNLPARRGPGAGLWMFVGPTARYYGLQVSANRDERLDVAAETRAAMQMFSDLWRQFGNWPLVLMAYNSGISRVDTGMNAAHTRDAWTLYRAGYGNDPDYLARTTAVMLILGHRRLLD
jgi:membrane-bound lytic murein transglycosylase D